MADRFKVNIVWRYDKEVDISPTGSNNIGSSLIKIGVGKRIIKTIKRDKFIFFSVELQVRRKGQVQ